MDRVAQDGMRVRTDAGKSSFRRGGRLEDLLTEAQHQVETLRHLAETDPEELGKRRRAAQERAARERRERVAESARQCEELRKKKEQRDQGRKEKTSEARASTTDPDARNMKFSDGGYRPGFNVQFATDTATGIVVGVDVTNAGTDNEQMSPMLDQLQTRYEIVPEEILVDGGFASLDAIDVTEDRDRVVYAPVKDEKKQREAGQDPFARKPHDTSHTAAWRERMSQDASRTIYKLRAQTAEWVNALCRNRGFWHMPVRGLVRSRIVATLYAIIHNLVHQGNVRAAAAEVRG
jgi:hypothetical protein